MDLLLIIGVADSIVCGARVVIDAGGEGKREYLDTGGRLLAAWRIRRLREKGNSTTLSGPKYLSELMRFMRQQGQFASKITHRNFSKKGVGLLLSRTPVGISIIDAYVDGVGVIESVPNAELKADNHYQGPFDGKQHNLNINKQTGLGYLTNEAGPVNTGFTICIMFWSCSGRGEPTERQVFYCNYLTTSKDQATHETITCYRVCLFWYWSGGSHVLATDMWCWNELSLRHMTLRLAAWLRII